LLLNEALEHAKRDGCEAKMIKLTELKFRHCEGYYSKSAYACTWPCSITQMDPDDQLDVVYEAFVHWADVILIATPIRWGNASSLYYKMVERMNCIQNQETIANKHLLKNKAAGFIITGGQDNVQAVAGQMLGFFSEVGCQFPQFPFIAHSRGWSAEDMENNVKAVVNSDDLKEGARGLAHRCIDMAKLLVAGTIAEPEMVRGGRKAHPLRIIDPK
jgi:multimeric flavodoxin WrbA